MNFFLQSFAAIHRASVSKNASGEVLASFAAIRSGVPCSIQPKSGTLRAAQAGQERASTHTAFFLTPVDLVAGDQIVADGITYRAIFVASYGRHVEVDADVS